MYVTVISTVCFIHHQSKILLNKWEDQFVPPGTGGDGCHPRVVPPGQLHRRPSTSKRFCLSAIFIEPGFFYFLCSEVTFSCVFFVFAFRCFRVFHRGCYVYFPIVFSSNSFYILYIFIFIYFLYIFSLYSGFFDLCWVIYLGCRPRIDRPAHSLYIYRIVLKYILVYRH